LIGARALGYESEYGSIDAGKRACLVAVTLPPDVIDVAEYLVNGIPPEDISFHNDFNAQ
jgi:imidazolonepropionase-like amidohydrolase